jgi:hypothetical protein
LATQNVAHATDGVSAKISIYTCIYGTINQSCAIQLMIAAQAHGEKVKQQANERAI